MNLHEGQKEPGFWVKWVVGMLGTVVTGVLVAVLAGAFKNDSPGPQPTATPTATPSARVRVTEFSAELQPLTRFPEARFKVYNAGDDSADRCHLFWNPFGPDPDAEGGLISDEFAVEPRTGHALTLRSEMRYSPGRSYLTTAKVDCSATSSEVASDWVLFVP